MSTINSTIFIEEDKIDIKNIKNNNQLNSNKKKIDLDNISTNKEQLKMNSEKQFKPISTNNNKNKMELNSIKKKIDFENISTNKEQITMNKNCKTMKNFNEDFYYNIVAREKAIELKKTNQYTSPCHWAMDNREEGEFTIKYDKEAQGAKTYTSYGNLTYKKLERISWKTNNHLFEIINKTQPRKMYFDIDKRFESEEDNMIVFKLINKLVKRTIEIDMKKADVAVCFGEGLKNNYKKVSWHIIVNGLFFKNLEDQQKFMNYLQYVITLEEEYEPLRNGVMDFNVYKQSQAFKLPYQSKAFGNIIQEPYNEDHTLKDFLLTNYNEEDYYDVSKFEEVNITKKKVRGANGKMITLDFNEATIIQSYKNSFSKDFHLGNVEGEKKDGLSYYLNSIPNNSKVPKFVFNTIGYCISNITKNSEEGLTLWAKWTCGFKQVKESDLREMYEKHSTTNGYGWKMLYNLASIHNKNMTKNESIYSTLFNDTPSYECETNTINSRYIECEQFNMREIVRDYDIINIKSPMGTGKSYSLKQIFKKYKSIVYFSCKRAFATSMEADFKEFGFKNYIDIENKTNIIDYEKIICSVESIHYCRDKYDLVIIDESESICDNMTGQMFKKNKPIEGATNIYDMIKNSNKVMVMDAYLSSRSFDMIKDIYKEDITNKKCYYLKNDFKYSKRNLIEVDSKGRFVDMIVDKVKNNKRVVVVCGSKKLNEEIVKRLKPLMKENELKRYDNRNKLNLDINVNEEWKGAKALLYTPTITAGISYDNKMALFDNLFIYCVNKGSCHFRDTIQAHKRVRDFTSKDVVVMINDKFRGHNLDIMPLTKEGVIEIEDKYKAQLFGSDTKTLKTMDKLDWIYNINIHNLLEFNISSVLLKGFAMKYLTCENIIQSETHNDIETLEIEDDEWKWDEIEDIRNEEHQNIVDRLNDKSGSAEIVNDDEYKQFIKFNLKHSHIKPECLGEGIEYFNEFYYLAQQRNKASEVRNFKRMLFEIKYDFNKFNEWKSYIKQQTNMPIEYYDMKVKRYEHLMKFFNKLGFIKGDKIDIDNEFSGKDFEKLIEDYKDIDVKALNTMLTDGYIRITKKDNFSTLNTKQIKGIFNQLLKDEFNLEVSSKGLKYVKGEDGKRKKLTIMGVSNATQSINKGKDTASEILAKEMYNNKWSNNKYNPFNFFTTNTEIDEEEEQVYDINEWQEDSEDEEANEELDCDFNDSEDISEEEAPPTPPPKVKKIIIKKKIGSQNIFKNECAGCGKETLNEYCLKCISKSMDC
tara:strand:+ start:7692 stop:11483 length:3792 start_codon:yes stop_codon:yes gene_type:complete